MPSQKFLRESQEETLAALIGLGDASAYDIMDVVAAGLTGNEDFAARQRVSGACSELHSQNRVHQVGTKINPSSGETVKVYRANPFPDQDCQCGKCPGKEGSDSGYKAKFEAAQQEILILKQQIAAGAFVPCSDCQKMYCRPCQIGLNRSQIKAVA